MRKIHYLQGVSSLEGAFRLVSKGDTLNASSQRVFCETLHLDVHAAVALSARAQLFT